MRQRQAFLNSHSQTYRDIDNDISLGELLAALWGRRWLIAGLTIVFALLSVVYALMATQWYRADALLVPAADEPAPSIIGQFGGIAGLAGIDLGGGNASEPLAVLRSRELAREFIVKQDLLGVFFAEQWDAAQQKWRDPDPEKWPDIRDAIKLFHKKILRVSEVDGGLVALSIEWTDPELAATWATLLIDRLNDRMRERALREAAANVEYLQSEMANTKLVTIQQSIGRLLETEFQKLMMARGRQEFSFRVIDSAIVPKERSRPRRALIAVLGTVAGGVVGFFVTLILILRRRIAAQRSGSSGPPDSSSS